MFRPEPAGDYEGRTTVGFSSELPSLSISPGRFITSYHTRRFWAKVTSLVERNKAAAALAEITRSAKTIRIAALVGATDPSPARIVTGEPDR